MWSDVILVLNNQLIIVFILFQFQSCASQNVYCTVASTSSDQILLYFANGSTKRVFPDPCLLLCRGWQGMSSRPGVEALCEGSSVMYRPHDGPAEKLLARLPVSTWGCPTGGWTGWLNTIPHTNMTQMAAFILTVCIYRMVCACKNQNVVVM